MTTINSYNSLDNILAAAASADPSVMLTLNFDEISSASANEIFNALHKHQQGGNGVSILNNKECQNSGFAPGVFTYDSAKAYQITANAATWAHYAQARNTPHSASSGITAFASSKNIQI